MRDPVENWIRSRFPAAAVSELAGDASTRRFFRISPEQGESGVLMDYGAPFAGLTDDQRLAL